MLVGIDTSCYTTSLSVIDPISGVILYDLRRLLQVKLGQRGLRQSEAVFQHLQNLPELLDGGFSGISITAVVASTKPRPAPGSYLPVFKAGASFGMTLAKILGVPFLETSHQEGHIRAGLVGKTKVSQTFLAWHISGGATELLWVQAGETGYRIQKIGGSSDLQIGQFVDRVGVALGNPFPAGPNLEKMALLSDTDKSLPVVTKGLTTSFSGPDSAAERLIHSGINGNDLARMVFHCIIHSLLKVTLEAVKEYKTYQVLMVGGVASNRIIRERLYEEGLKTGIEFLFARTELSSDNAVGVGFIGYDCLNGKDSTPLKY
jgi:N6-L-threonylcarbamoyladenine synthase